MSNFPSFSAENSKISVFLKEILPHEHKKGFTWTAMSNRQDPAYRLNKRWEKLAKIPVKSTYNTLK